MRDRPFEPGDRIAGRFRIVREVGRGGMGVVYEATDERLECRVAIKAARPGHHHRLPPEARAAREVSHLNVCKVHELHSVETASGEVEFLSMEFIEGETLSARIRTAGSLSPRETREITLDLCAGLEQAHRQGVIHGDLKAANVILSRTPGGGARAVLTDFGLASLRPASDEGSGSTAGGTRDYMAPELFSGTPAGVASDIYALGILIHEMLTGFTPVWQDAPQAAPVEGTTVTLAPFRPGPASVRRCAALPSPWNSVVAGCLMPDPENRFRSAAAVADRLRAVHPLRKWGIAGAPVLAAAAALWLWPAADHMGPAIRLAVLPPVVEGEAVPGASGLAIDVADRLAGAQRGFVVIPPTEALRYHVDGYEKAKAALAATHVLGTRLKSGGGHIEVHALVIDAVSGSALRELDETYSREDVPVLAKALTATVTGAFHLRRVPEESVAPAAYGAYIEGIGLLRRDLNSAGEAIPFFERAVQADPRSALTYAGLAEAQLQKFARGYGGEWLDHASASVARAQSLHPDLPAVLLAAGLLHQYRGQYDVAARQFQRAADLAPDNPECWSRLATLYGIMDRPLDAVAAYRKAIAAQPDHYVNYLRFGNFYYGRGELKEAEEAYRKVVSIAPALSSGHMNLGLALQQEGRLAEAERAMNEAVRLEPSGRTFGNLGVLFYQQKRYAEAAKLFEKSLQYPPPNAIFYEDLGDAYRHSGRRRESAEAYRKAFAMDEAELFENPRDPYPRARLAFLAAELGDGRRALSEITQALGLSRDDARIIRYAAFTFEVLGKRERTLEVLAKAPRRLLEELGREPDLEALRRDPAFQRLLRGKTE